MIEEQAVVKLGASSRVGRSVPEGQSEGAFQRGVGCPQVLHGRRFNQFTFRFPQPLTVTFTLDQYSAPVNTKRLPLNSAYSESLIRAGRSHSKC